MIRRLERRALENTDNEIDHRRLTHAMVDGDEQNQINKIILPQFLALFDVEFRSCSHFGVLNGFIQSTFACEPCL